MLADITFNLPFSVLFLPRVQSVVGVKPNDVKDFLNKKSMHPTIFVRRY
jgi:hypothetical protein